MPRGLEINRLSEISLLECRAKENIQNIHYRDMNVEKILRYLNTGFTACDIKWNLFRNPKGVGDLCALR